ncbi:hypothetical protein [Shimia sp. MMG029]|uniref:hypothetical protein n=1 Tax=Shimia sp. MMG029 TaxID=3021978 RepID=UPI0022FE1C3A|nr:hypothetical protein [Shimia sp. MMG029]MDA5556414.1 hypothetical protein [Shimia sp. MMG029]
MLTAFEIVSLMTIAVAHLFALRFKRHLPEATRWLQDFSCGLGLGYAFLYLLPKIGSMTGQIALRQPEAHVLVEHQLYVYLFGGFLAYYLIDFGADAVRFARVRMAFNALSFLVYNVLVGITILHINEPAAAFYVVSSLVFVLHLFGVNSFLISHYADDFRSWMRFAFVAAVAAGGLIGRQIEKYDPYQSVATAIVGGIVIILSIRLKLPAREHINTRAFLFGVAAMIAAVVIYAAGDMR